MPDPIREIMADLPLATMNQRPEGMLAIRRSEVPEAYQAGRRRVGPGARGPDRLGRAVQGAQRQDPGPAGRRRLLRPAAERVHRVGLSQRAPEVPRASAGSGIIPIVERTIAHLDMDAFYASVELRRRPELRGKPIVVAGSGPRAVVTTASYEARAAHGIGSAMPLSQARRLCPELIVVPPDFDAYRAVSRQVMGDPPGEHRHGRGRRARRGLPRPDRLPHAERVDAAGPRRDRRPDRPDLLDRPRAEQAAREDRERPAKSRPGP